jgi:hypothetical protein
MAEFISEEEFLKLQQEKRGVDPNAEMMVSDLPPVGGAEFISEEEFLQLQNKRNTPNANNPTSTLGAYLKSGCIPKGCAVHCCGYNSGCW